MGVGLTITCAHVWRGELCKQTFHPQAVGRLVGHQVGRLVVYSVGQLVVRQVENVCWLFLGRVGDLTQCQDLNK